MHRPIAIIAAAVIGAHVLLLQSVSMDLRPHDPLAVKSLITRTLVLQQTQAVVEPPSPTAATEMAAPQPVRSARAVTPRIETSSPDVASVPVAAASAPPLQPAPPGAPAEQMPPAALASALPPPAPSPTSTAPTVALAVPGSIKLNYKVFVVYRGQDRQASGQLHWRHDGVNYDAKLEMSIPLLGSRSDHSVGRLTSEGLEPLRYASKSRNEEATHFDRERGRIVFSANRPEAALMTGAQDRLSVILQLASLAAGNPATFRAGSTVTIQTAGPRDAELWIFAVDGEEQLQMPGGSLDALKLTRLPRKEFDQKVEMWFAPGMDYVPVRVRLTNSNGDSFDQQWSGTDKG